MGRIDGFAHVASIDANEFFKIVKERINEWQQLGQEVEVQYSTTPYGHCGVTYSAMIIGRVETK